MLTIPNQKGISTVAIMLFGVLTLTVVVANGIVFSVEEQERLANGEEIARSYCTKNPEQYPSVCSVSSVVACENWYVVSSDCLGVGHVIYDTYGNYLAWCGYNSLDGQAVACDKYLTDSKGNNCLTLPNLCQ